MEQRNSASDNGEIDMVDVLIVLAKYKHKIAMATFGAAVLSLAVSLVLPNEYEAATKLLPPQQTQSSAAALLTQLGGIAGAAAAGATGLKNPNDLYVGMLRSRTVADHLIEQFHLRQVYGTDSQEHARKILEDNTRITSGKDGLITVAVSDENKQRVAPLANAYVSELFQLMKTLAVTDAAQRRLFYEGQLASTKDALAKAEIALRSAMDTQGVISVDAESRTILETIARLRAQTSAKEIQLASMGAFLTPSNPEFRRTEVELNGLRSELGKLENGRGAESPNTASKGGLQNIKLLRDLKYQQMLYEVLAKQYEVARIDEAKDPSVIQVLDRALDPERKSKPRRALLTILGAATGLFASIFWAFFSDSRRRKLMTPEGSARWEELKSHLRLSKRSSI
jgi:tyrosine-protein kinase Etk/Wzc